ncbi:caspase family protein [Streptomyces sp. NPDC093149]|uniref:caspase, EACC1-associated type n=1 Tax=Streptomyces sp. NPDC093149 TaxID=3366031 RepID=UPI00380DE1FF
MVKDHLRQESVQVIGARDSASGTYECKGTGFFVAPGVVLTSAKVVREAMGEGATGGFAVCSKFLDAGRPVPARLRQWLVTDPMAPISVADDIALVELLDPVPQHECVWLGNMIHDYFYDLYFAAYVTEFNGRQGLAPVTGSVRIVEPLRGHLWRAERIEANLAGAAAADQETAAVCGMSTNGSPDDPQMIIGISALRRFGAGYQSVITAHDAWHGLHQGQGHAPTWIDIQVDLAEEGGNPRGKRWTPRDRCTALALLADLAHPEDESVVRDILGRLGELEFRILARPSGLYGEEPLLCWRDGLSLLHRCPPTSEVNVHLRYLRLVAEHLHARGHDVGPLAEWIGDRSGRCSFDERQTLWQPGDPQDVPKSGINGSRRRVRSSGALPCWRTGGALLVGGSMYRHLPNLPTVAHNLEDLHGFLTSPRFGVPATNCRVVKDPQSAEEVHDAIDEIVDAVDPSTGAFLFYYAGHGRSHPSHGEFLLSTAGSREDRPYSYWDFAKLRGHLVDTGSLKRLVILDSCYSGSALETLSAGDDSGLAIDGTYVMTSSGATQPSMARPGERNTAFTGEILRALRDGIPGVGPVINTNQLFESVKAACRAAQLPVPARQIRNDASKIPLVYNEAFGGELVWRV